MVPSLLRLRDKLLRIRDAPSGDADVGTEQRRLRVRALDKDITDAPSDQGRV